MLVWFLFVFFCNICSLFSQQSYCTLGPFSTAMGDCLRAGKPSWYVTCCLGQLSRPSFWVGKSSTILSGWG